MIEQTYAMICERHQNTEIPGASVATLYNDVGDLIEHVERLVEILEQTILCTSDAAGCKAIRRAALNALEYYRPPAGDSTK